MKSVLIHHIEHIFMECERGRLYGVEINNYFSMLTNVLSAVSFDYIEFRRSKVKNGFRGLFY